MICAKYIHTLYLYVELATYPRFCFFFNELLLYFLSCKTKNPICVYIIHVNVIGTTGLRFLYRAEIRKGKMERKGGKRKRNAAEENGKRDLYRI